MNRKNEAGYTLLEMVLAISIFSIVIFTVGLGMFSIRQTWQKIHKHSNILKQYETLDRVFNSSFRNAIPFAWTDSQGEKKSIFYGRPDEISFAYMHRVTENSRSGIRFIKIFLDNDGNLVAAYRKSPILYWDTDDTGLEKEVLAEDVKNISFLYADKNTKGEICWTDSWNIEENSDLPFAIQISIEKENGEKESWLRRTAGAGIFESFGSPKIRRKI